MDGRSRRRFGLLALVALVWLSGCSFATPNVCGPPCYAAGIATEQGYNVTAEREHLTIDVRADGSARWTARLDLTGPGVSRLQADPSAVRSIARSTFEEPSFSAAPASPRNLTARLTGRTLVVAFDDPGFGHRGVGGLVVVDRFNREPAGSQGGYDVDVDAVVLRGPSGTVVANRPPNGAVRGSSVTYREYVAKKTLVVFAPDRTASRRGAAELAVFLEVLEWTLWPTLVGAVPGTSLLVGVGVILVYDRQSDWDLAADLRAGRWWAAGVLVALAVAAVWVVSSPNSNAGVDVVGWAVLLSPVVALGGLGVVVHRGACVRAAGLAGLAGLAVAGSFGAVLLGGADLSSALVYTSIWATAGVVVGTPLYVVGRRYVALLQEAG